MKEYIKKILIDEMGHTESDIKSMTPNEIFEIMLNYEGIIGYASKIKSWVKDIYGIEIK